MRPTKKSDAIDLQKAAHSLWYAFCVRGRFAHAQTGSAFRPQRKRLGQYGGLHVLQVD